MKIIKKIILNIKNIFIKHNEVKKLIQPENILQEKRKDNFITSLKVSYIDNTQKRENIEIETPICDGDGLGIQKRMSS